MNIKTFNHIKKVIIVSAIIMLCSTNVAYGFTIGSQAEKKNTLRDFFSRFIESEKEEYSLTDLQIDLKKMEYTGNIDLNQITELIDKLPEGTDKELFY